MRWTDLQERQPRLGDLLHAYADAFSAALPWSPVVGRFHLFAVDIEQATYLRYDKASGDQHLVIWPPAREVVRRGTSATTVGGEEPVRDLLR